MFKFGDEKFYDSESFSYSLNKELDYSVSEASQIDSRVLQVCKDAENSFLENQRSIKEIKKMREVDYKLNFSKTNQNKSKSRENIKHRYSNNYSEFNENSLIKNINKNPVIIDKEKIQKRENHLNYNNNKQILHNEVNKTKLKLDENKISNNNKINFLPHSHHYKNLSIDLDLNIKSPSKLQKKDKNTLQENTSENYKRLNLTHKHIKSGKKCIACELKKR
jgi:hypothetical protein